MSNPNLCPFCNAIAFPNPDGDGEVIAWDECANGHQWMSDDRSTLLRIQWKRKQGMQVTADDRKEEREAWIRQNRIKGAA